jgi:hypothetical protein
MESECSLLLLNTLLNQLNLVHNFTSYFAGPSNRAVWDIGLDHLDTETVVSKPA